MSKPRLYCRFVTPLLDGSAVGLLATGAAIGAVLMVLGTVLAGRLPARRLWGIPISGVAMAVPVAIVTTDAAPLGALGIGGLALLLLAGAVLPANRPALVHGAASIPGAALLAAAADGWGIVLVIVGVPILVVAASRFEGGHRQLPGLSGVVAAIATGGAFLTVPDTEHVALMAGGAIVVGLATFVRPKLTLGASGAVWAGAFVWSVAIDGSGRAAGIVGALGALGLLVLDPAVRVNLHVDRGLVMYLPAPSARARLVQVAAIQIALSLFASRVAGLRMDVIMALVLTVVAWVTVGLLLGRYAQVVSSGQGPV